MLQHIHAQHKVESLEPSQTRNTQEEVVNGREKPTGGGKKKQEGKATEVFKFYAAWLSYASLTKKQTKVGRIQVWQNSLYHNI